MIDIIKTTNPFSKTDDCLKITNSQSNELAYNFGDILEESKSYTFSCWFKADTNLNINIYISDKQSQEYAISTKWTKIVFTATADISKSKKVLFSIPANKTLYAYEGMLELGNLPSDFKPNDKDVDNKVVTLQTNFEIQQGQINSLIKETTIVDDYGKSTSLKDKYLETVATVDGIKIDIGDIQTSQDSMSSKMAALELTAKGLTSSVEKAQNTGDSAQTLAKQTADKFQWIVKSGSSATDFTLTDRTAQLVADSINLKGLVTFKGLDSSTQNKINDANNKIDNLQVGGRNLLRNSSKLPILETSNYSTGVWRLAGNSTMKRSHVDISDPPKSCDTITGAYQAVGKHPTSEKDVECIGIDNFPYFKNCKLGDTCTFSAWARVVGGGENCYFGFSTYLCNSILKDCFGYDRVTNNYAQKSLNSDGSWTRVVIHFKLTKFLTDNIYVGFLTGDNEVTVQACAFKLEKGSVATDWTPAPEDKADQSIIDNWAKDSVVNGETTINGGYIKTNTIKTDQLAVGDIFATGSAVMNTINAQEINANRITSGLLSAKRINAYGLSILNKTTNQQTFNISNNGEVTIRGSVSSGNYVEGKTGWAINNDGTAEFNDIVARGSVITSDGGIVSSGGSGRNIATSTNQGTKGWDWSMEKGDCTKSEVLENGIRTCKFIRSSIPHSGWSVIGYTNINRNKWMPNTVYTISVDVKSSIKSWFNLQIVTWSSTDSLLQSVTSVQNGSKANEWAKLIWVVKTKTVLPDSVNQILYFTGANSNVNAWHQFCNLKIEEGTTPTAWSPAPEDKFKQVRFWAGSSFEERESAPFIVYSDGSIRATQGEYSGLWTGDIKIGNISIIDPSASAGNDALLTIQNGANGVKRVQLTDNISSSFAQDIIVTNNTYSPMISLKQDGSAYFSRGINIADKTTLNSSGLIINNKTLTTTSNGSGFLFNNELNIGTANQSANLIVHGNTSTDNIIVDSTLYFGNILKFTKNANGINIDFI